MHPEPDDLEMLTSKCRAMDIDELKTNISNWEVNTACSFQLQKLDVAKNELKLKYEERQEQIDLLTKSLSSSSRIGRWISSIKSVLKQFVDFKN